MNLDIKGPLPESSAPRFVAAMNDTHISGLINHCVEVMVWKNRILWFLAGFSLAAVIFSQLRR